MEPRAQRPKGDAFGTLGEKVAPLRLKNRPLLGLRQRQRALLVICVGALLVVLDASATAVALPLIQQELGFSGASITWVVSAQLIPFGVFLLLASRLSKVVGPRLVFTAGVGLYTAALVACGLAPTALVLIIARFVQGLGGALLTGVSFGMLVSMFPRPREQVNALGLFGLVAAAGPLVGLVATAAIIDGLGWRWSYALLVPVGVGALRWGWHRLPKDDGEPSPGRRVGWIGSVLTVAALMSMVQSLVWASGASWAPAVLTFVIAVALLGYAVLRRVRIEDSPISEIVAGDRNLLWSNVILGVMSIGPTSTLFIGALYAHRVFGYDPMQFGWAFLPFGIVGAIVSVKITPRLLEHVDPRTLMIVGSVTMAAGLALVGLTPGDHVYAVDLLPGLVTIGIGTGLGLPAAFAALIVGAHSSQQVLRANMANVGGKIGAGLGLAVLTAQPADWALGSLGGYGLSWLVASGVLLVGAGMAAGLMKPVVETMAHSKLDPLAAGSPPVETPLRGIIDPDFLAIGLGGTNMMAMLWSVAVGRRAVGVELRGSPTEAVMHWQIREELYHHLVLIDRMMMERYGEDRLPRLGNGELFSLSECFFSSDPTSAGDARADEVLSGFVVDSHIAGLVESVELIDDRWKDGRPVRSISTLGEVPRPGPSDTSSIGRPMSEVIAERAVFQVGAQELLNVLRRYLTEMERIDLEAGVEPRCRVLTYHRVLQSDPSPREREGERGAERGGFIEAPDGRKRILIEAIHEMEGKRDFTRVRRPGTEIIDVGVPELFMIAEGVDSEDAARLGFETTPLTIDRDDALGPVVAQADYISGS